MIDGGDGGLAITMEMKQYKVINENTPCATREEAEDIIRQLNFNINSTYYGFPIRPKSKYAEFQITGGLGVGFYIWMSVIESDPEVQTQIDGWTQVTSRGLGLKEAQSLLDESFSGMSGYEFKTFCVNDLYYIYCRRQ